MIQWVLAIWSLFPLPFKNSACTLEVLVHILLKPSLKDFEHYFASMWNEWVQLCGSLNILWHCPSLGLEWKLTISSPVGTAEFSKFTGIYCHTVNPKRNQLWILTGSMDAEAEAPPDAKSQLIGKDSDVGKDWREKGKVIAKDVVVRRHHWFSGYYYCCSAAWITLEGGERFSLYLWP